MDDEYESPFYDPPFYVGGAKHIPDGATTFNWDPNWIPTRGERNFPDCYKKALQSGDLYSNYNPCVNLKIGRGPRGNEEKKAQVMTSRGRII
jgi:hypothetical protein